MLNQSKDIREERVCTILSLIVSWLHNENEVNFDMTAMHIGIYQINMYYQFYLLRLTRV